MHLVNLIITVFLLLNTAHGFPLFKRFFRPSSEVFSVIAHHNGGVFKYHLLKWNGEALMLNADEEAFFGRVRASQGYVLNLPMTGTTGMAGTINVQVDNTTNQLITTPSANNASHGFGIFNSRLAYQNSTEFLACPDLSYRGQYSVYFGNFNKTKCPSNARGYTIELIVQTNAYSNYNPSSNRDLYPPSNATGPDIPIVLKGQNTKRFYFF
ncbi:hypothetical protein JCM33374_g3160 [Metschnikowia sp. JCM 33374]|nr:hypothetical protein JCM33374_g3160 [Metschnikowia sp. JCM 33374]